MGLMGGTTALVEKCVEVVKGISNVTNPLGCVISPYLPTFYKGTWDARTLGMKCLQALKISRSFIAQRALNP